MKCCILLLTAAVAIASGALAAFGAESLAAVRQALAKGELAQALILASKAIEADPKNPACFAARATVYDAQREFGKAIVDYGHVIELTPNALMAYERRGEDQFRLGQFKESVTDFDKVIELEPDRAPYHWQRGISQYYAGDFKGGAKQFETHKSVNPEDVENAVWHYLCVARSAGVEEARKGLIPIHSDTRVPMMQVYAMFEGKATADDVLSAAKAGSPGDAELKDRLFYAHLYIGLFQEAAGQTDSARTHILLAAEKYADSGYMGDVARVHAAVLKKQAP